MTKWRSITATVLILLLGFTALGATNLEPEIMGDGLLVDETWSYVGYTYGGITFAIPKESAQKRVGIFNKASGIILIFGNDDYTVQLRSFNPDSMTYSEFKELILSEPTAQVNQRLSGEAEILSYRNTAPSETAELFGIAMTGVDGKLYKISIFTGDSGAYQEDAPVWKIAEIIEKTTRIQDFSDWGI